MSCVFVLVRLLSSLRVDYLPASALDQYYNVSLTTLTFRFTQNPLLRNQILLFTLLKGADGLERAIEMLFRNFASNTSRRLQPTIHQLLTRELDPQTILSVTGFIKSVRKQKRVAFVAVNDGSCPEGLQAVLSPEDARACVIP